MRPVSPSSQFQASQQLSMISSVVRKTRCERRLSSQMQPQPLDRVEFRRVGRQEDEAEVFGHHQIAGGMPARLVHQHHAMRAGGDRLDSSARNRFIAAVSSRVSTSATPVSRAGQTAPMIQADW